MCHPGYRDVELERTGPALMTSGETENPGHDGTFGLRNFVASGGLSSFGKYNGFVCIDSVAKGRLGTTIVGIAKSEQEVHATESEQ